MYPFDANENREKFNANDRLAMVFSVRDSDGREYFSSVEHTHTHNRARCNLMAKKCFVIRKALAANSTYVAHLAPCRYRTYQW